MPRERVLITVKTYPTLSRKYGETVCTAGLRADGSWMRIYPVPFRRLGEEQQYAKFDWVETDFVKGTFDPRPETHHPVDRNTLRKVATMGREEDWRERRALVLGKATIYDRLQPLFEGAKANALSLAVFKPTRLLDFTVEDDDPDWPEGKVAEMRAKMEQSELFADDEEWRRTFQLIPKLPFKFRYRFEDADGRTTTMRILDWECGQLYWNCFRRDHDRENTVAKVRQKYFEILPQTDLHLCLGALQQFHGFSPNPWAVIGVFTPPHVHQLDLGLGI